MISLVWLVFGFTSEISANGTACSYSLSTLGRSNRLLDSCMADYNDIGFCRGRDDSTGILVDRSTGEVKASLQNLPQRHSATKQSIFKQAILHSQNPYSYRVIENGQVERRNLKTGEVEVRTLPPELAFDPKISRDGKRIEATWNGAKVGTANLQDIFRSPNTNNSHDKSSDPAKEVGEPNKGAQSDQPIQDSFVPKLDSLDRKEDRHFGGPQVFGSSGQNRVTGSFLTPEETNLEEMPLCSDLQTWEKESLYAMGKRCRSDDSQSGLLNLIPDLSSGVRRVGRDIHDFFRNSRLGRALMGNQLYSPSPLLDFGSHEGLSDDGFNSDSEADGKRGSRGQSASLGLLTTTDNSQSTNSRSLYDFISPMVDHQSKMDHQEDLSHPRAPALRDLSTADGAILQPFDSHPAIDDPDLFDLRSGRQRSRTTGVKRTPINLFAQLLLDTDFSAGRTRAQGRPKSSSLPRLDQTMMVLPRRRIPLSDPVSLN